MTMVGLRGVYEPEIPYGQLRRAIVSRRATVFFATSCTPWWSNQRISRDAYINHPLIAPISTFSMVSVEKKKKKKTTLLRA